MSIRMAMLKKFHDAGFAAEDSGEIVDKLLKLNLGTGMDIQARVQKIAEFRRTVSLADIRKEIYRDPKLLFQPLPCDAPVKAEKSKDKNKDKAQSSAQNTTPSPPAYDPAAARKEMLIFIEAAEATLRAMVEAIGGKRPQVSMLGVIGHGPLAGQMSLLGLDRKLKEYGTKFRDCGFKSLSTFLDARNIAPLIPAPPAVTAPAEAVEKTQKMPPLKYVRDAIRLTREFANHAVTKDSGMIAYGNLKGKFTWAAIDQMFVENYGITGRTSQKYKSLADFQAQRPT